MDDDEIIYWQDVIETVAAGRTTGLKCPYCYQATISVTKKERTTLLQCTNAACRHFIEGRLPETKEETQEE